MKCGYCGEDFEPPAKLCPHCGKDPGSGVYQTSAVLIATREGKSLYASVAEVPLRLRVKLMKCTTGASAGTIIIADRRGRQEISRALRPGGRAASAVARLPRWLRVVILVLLVLVALSAVGAAFLRF